MHEIEKAADAVEREIADLRAKLSVAVEALTRVANYAGSSQMTLCEINVTAWSRAALAQIKGDDAVARIQTLKAERDRFAERHERHLILGAEVRARAEKAEAKLAVAMKALELIESITVHSGGEIHGVTAHHWQTGFDVAKDEAIIALAQIKGDE